MIAPVRISEHIIAESLREGFLIVCWGNEGLCDSDIPVTPAR